VANPNSTPVSKSSGSSNPSRWLLTLGDTAQIEGALKGGYLKGNHEPRLALVGRSNVGKSSLINAILGLKLAQTSAQPGKTRLLHFYLWSKPRKILADLPGYGFAKAAKTERDRWSEFINAYLSADQGLERAVVLLDARHGPTELDQEAIKFMDFSRIPVTFVFTKSDQLKNQSERARRKKEAEQAIRDLGHDPSAMFWVSVRDKRSVETLAKVLGADL